MTYALGFVCLRSQAFVTVLVKAVGGTVGLPEDGMVALQTSDCDGRTDVELGWPGVFHGVFDAKHSIRARGT